MKPLTEQGIDAFIRLAKNMEPLGQRITQAQHDALLKKMREVYGK